MPFAAGCCQGDQPACSCTRLSTAHMSDASKQCLLVTWHLAVQKKLARRQSKRRAQADQAAAAVAEQLASDNEYEQRRHNNILRNRQVSL